jgi:DNA-binding NtrC family response regulator
VAAIVKGHGGFLTVDSESGKGTTFTIYLPASTEGSTAVAKDNTDDLPVGQNETVLVVDDESAIREITKETLEVYGYKVLTAQDGVEALSVYESNKREIDLVLTDMMMPYMDGGVLIRTLQRIDPKIKIIAVSGLMDGESATEMAKTKVHGFLQKPFKADKLLIMLRNTLDGKARIMN